MAILGNEDSKSTEGVPASHLLISRMTFGLLSPVCISHFPVCQSLHMGPMGNDDSKSTEGIPASHLLISRMTFGLLSPVCGSHYTFCQSLHDNFGQRSHGQ